MTPVARRPVRLGWWLTAVLLGVVAAAVVVVGIDWGRRRAFHRFLTSRDPDAYVRYVNDFTGEAGWVARLRQATGGPVAFDRPDELRLHSLDDASVRRLVDGFEALGEPRRLRILGCSLTDAGLLRIAELTRPELVQLECIYPRRNRAVTDRGGRAVAAMPNLVSLNLSGTDIGDETARAVAASQTIRVLRLENTRLTDAGLTALAGAPRLEWLEVDRSAVTHAGAWAFRRARPEVQWASGPMSLPSGVSPEEVEAYLRARDASHPINEWNW